LYNNKTYQNTQANRGALQNLGSTTLYSLRDHGIFSNFLLPALGCTGWNVPDLADPGNNLPSLPLNEIQAGIYQKSPFALIPLSAIGGTINGQTSSSKVNAWRMELGQPLLNGDGDPTIYCNNLYQIAPKRIASNLKILSGNNSPNTNVAQELYAFMALRFYNTYETNGLNCIGLLGIPPPVTIYYTNGVATGAIFHLSGVIPMIPMFLLIVFCFLLVL